MPIENGQECVVGVFATTGEARRFVEQLERDGWQARHVSLVTPQSGGAVPDVDAVEDEDAMEKSALVGGGAGAAVGLLAGTALFAIPGVGPVLFAGALASGLTGGVVGGLVGAMSGWGVSKGQVEQYEQQLAEGKSLVLLTGDPDELATAQRKLEESAAEAVHLHAASADSPVDK